jgi:hypothetical protein
LTGDKDERFVEEPSAVEPAFKNFIALPWLGVWKSPKVEASEPEALWEKWLVMSSWEESVKVRCGERE